MKKTLMTFAVFLFFSVSSFAGFNFNLWSGFTTVGMEKVNNYYINHRKDVLSNWFITNFGSTPSVTVNNIGAGYILGIDTSYSPVSFISLGIKTGYLNAGGSFKLSITNYSRERNLTTTLIPLMAGIKGQISIPGSPVFVGGDIYSGYAFAGFRMEDKTTTGSTITTTWLEADGGTFIADILAKIGYKFSSLLFSEFQIGYRIATVKEMKVSKKSAPGAFGIPVGEAIPDISGKPIEFDYSGFIVSVSIGLTI